MVWFQGSGNKDSDGFIHKKPKFAPMRITELRLVHFKRFTDLTISGIPAAAKLVLLIGSNGSGKSSVFDAFDYVRKQSPGTYPADHQIYYPKNGLTPTVSLTFSNNQTQTVNNNNIVQGNDALTEKFFGRSSIRIVPRISNQANPTSIQSDADAPLTYIDPDIRFTNDLFQYMQQIDNSLREPVFAGKQADTLQIFQNFIQPLNQSLINIFGGDETITIQIAEYQSPTVYSNGKLIFRKGESKINYDLLSHGEKQVVILLLNFIVRKQYYNDAILFIDEMDCHLNTSLQYRLLEEIVSVWIPDNAQLWTATHALGFIDYARRSEQAAIIDLNLLNFDLPQVITPQPKESLEVYDVAIPKETLQHILRGARPVVVENTSDEHYNLALADKGYLFLPANNNREVFLTVKGDGNMLGLRDRDYLQDDEIAAIKRRYPNLKILELYAFENYVYHPDNLDERGLPGFDKKEYITQLTEAKNKRLLTMAAEIATARQTYVEFKEGIKNDGKIEAIIGELQSNDFDRFYPYFSIKKYYDKLYLQPFNLQLKNLVKTRWFRKQMEDVLKN